MSEGVARTESPMVLVHLQPVINMSDDEFFDFCQLNRELRIERTAGGDLLIMPPVGGETSARNNELGWQLTRWAKKDGSGVVFDSSCGFVLPNGATRSPDAAWIEQSRLAALTPSQKKKFIPLCPDFVIELRSPSDSLKDVKEKMEEYVSQGTRLGWLFDPVNRRVHVYRPQAAVESIAGAASLSGEPVLKGFVLDLKPIWEVAL